LTVKLQFFPYTSIWVIMHEYDTNKLSFVQDKRLAENGYVDSSSIEPQTFCGLKEMKKIVMKKKQKKKLWSVDRSNNQNLL